MYLKPEARLVINSNTASWRRWGASRTRDRAHVSTLPEHTNARKQTQTNNTTTATTATTTTNGIQHTTTHKSEHRPPSSNPTTTQSNSQVPSPNQPGELLLLLICHFFLRTKQGASKQRSRYFRDCDKPLIVPRHSARS